MAEVKIASSNRNCPHCWGSGVTALKPFYYIACLWCQGSGKYEDDKEVKESAKENTQAGE